MLGVCCELAAILWHLQCWLGLTCSMPALHMHYDNEWIPLGFTMSCTMACGDSLAEMLQLGPPALLNEHMLD